MLRHATGANEPFGIYTQTPQGLAIVDFVDQFEMPNGRVLLAWKDPFKHQPMHNLVVTFDGGREIVNLIPVERMWEFYDRPLDSEIGGFSFVNSLPGDPGKDEWRCDKHGYTARVWIDAPRMFSGLNDLKAIEYPLSVNGVGHVMYLQVVDAAPHASKYDADVTPLAARTFQEIMKLISEWAAVHEQPFGNREPIAIAAARFMEAMAFDDQELSVIHSQTPMQIANFLAGSEDARRRPTGIKPLDKEMKRLLFRRMASTSLSVVFALDGQTFVSQDQIVDQEIGEIHNGIRRFRNYYGIPESVDLTDTELLVSSVVDHREQPSAFVLNQARNFVNKLQILEEAANGNL